jgi:uncharacterized membrane protein
VKLFGKPISGILLKILPFVIFLAFFAAYSTLTIVRHNNYQSFGFDLGINDQTVWRYSHFEAPITTIDPFPDKTKLYTHVELVYALISPAYWISSSRKMLLMLEAFVICSGGLAVFFLAQKRKLKYSISIAVMITYLMFYGVQNAIWFDVHSSTFAAGFLAWFLYFLSSKKYKWAFLFFLLSITAKEDIALITFFISLAYLFVRRDKFSLLLSIISISYIIFIFFIYFPHIIHFSYLYQNRAGLISNLNPAYLVNTSEKLQTIFYSFLNFGFISFLLPTVLLPIIAHFFTFFVLASDLPGAQGLYMHYRVTLAPVMAWATIITIEKFPRLNNKYVAIYLLGCALFVQYNLHLPLSYLSKQYFWQEPAAVKNINYIRGNFLPRNASVVAQNNIVPHISHRDQIYSLYPETKKFTIVNSPCAQTACDWFRWYDHPTYLLVDTSADWDARHLLTDQPKIIKGINNLEKTGVIKKYKQRGNTVLYKVVMNPDDYKE